MSSYPLRHSLCDPSHELTVVMVPTEVVFKGRRQPSSQLLASQTRLKQRAPPRDLKVPSRAFSNEKMLTFMTSEDFERSLVTLRDQSYRLVWVENYHYDDVQ